MDKPYFSCQFDTDTATMAIFDPAQLMHRCKDDADWWSIAEDELAEQKQANALFINLADDGIYHLDVYNHSCHYESSIAHIKGVIQISSGCLYLGAAEQVPAGGLGPDTTAGGCLIFAECGAVEVCVYRPTPQQLVVDIKPYQGQARNDFSQLLRL